MGGALEAVAAGPRLILVTGHAGTGKTMLLGELQGTLRDRGCEVQFEPRGDILEGVSPPSPGGVLLIDEADRLDPALLPSLLQGGGGLVLAVLNPPPLDALPLSPALLELRPLDADGVIPFMAALLEGAGLRPDTFSAEAVAHLSSRSERIPRLVTALADASLWLAEADGAACVGPEHVEAAAEGRIPGLPTLRAEPSPTIVAGVLPPAPAAPVEPSPTPSHTAAELVVVDGPATPSPDAGGSSTLPPTAPSRRPVPSRWPVRARAGVAAACAIALLGLATWGLTKTGGSLLHTGVSGTPGATAQPGAMSR